MIPKTASCILKMKKHAMPENSKTILVISLQGIGDLLLTTPLIRALKTGIPDSNILVLTFKTNSLILAGNPYVDETIYIDYNNILKVSGLLLNLRRRKIDVSICAYPSGIRSAFLGYLSGADVRLGQGFSLFNNYKWLFTGLTHITKVKHAILMNLDFLGLLGVDKERAKKDPVLNILESEERAAEEFLRENGIRPESTLIGIHAGGGRFTQAYRSWSKEKFAQLSDLLLEKHRAEIVFIGGHEDEILVGEITTTLRHKVINAAGKLTLKQTAALISKFRILICNNSSPMHVAAALGIPTVSIFGSADTRIHRPWGENHIVLQKNLDCSPCYYPFFRDTLPETKEKSRWFGKKLKCIKGNYECISLIEVEEVYKAVEDILRKR